LYKKSLQTGLLGRIIEGENTVPMKREILDIIERREHCTNKSMTHKRGVGIPIQIEDDKQLLIFKS
jgi:hypothetical protein